MDNMATHGAGNAITGKRWYNPAGDLEMEEQSPAVATAQRKRAVNRIRTRAGRQGPQCANPETSRSLEGPWGDGQAVFSLGAAGWLFALAENHSKTENEDGTGPRRPAQYIRR